MDPVQEPALLPGQADTLAEYASANYASDDVPPASPTKNTKHVHWAETEAEYRRHPEDIAPSSKDEENAIQSCHSQISMGKRHSIQSVKSGTSQEPEEKGKMLYRGNTSSNIEAPTRFQLIMRKNKTRYKHACKTLCSSRIFAALTTSLTIYALFGDDMRLMFTDKPDDVYFDWVTICAMLVFFVEIVCFCGGKPDYLFGFFFWLDGLATITLLLDVTYIGEALFGDSVSKAAASGSRGDSGAGDSSEAARAARMSRAGTKAGRVVRLIRLLRLLKMLKARTEKKDQIQNIPGDDFDDDEDVAHEESAVSKTLSEMTTRRVIVLVLTIMICLPFFEASMFAESLGSSGQYGINVIYRRLRDGLHSYKVDKNASNSEAYLKSKDRRVYEDAFLLYLYKHNWFTDTDDVSSDQMSPADSFNRLFWVGATPDDAPLAKYMAPKLMSYDWNEKWSGANHLFFSGNVPQKAQSTLTAPWNESWLCVTGIYRGRSLVLEEDSRVRCPEDLRYQERTAIYPQLLTKDEASELFFMFVFDRRSGSKYEAMLNTFQTIFISLLLGIGSMTFSSDANKLVLSPIERMMAKLERIRHNPLEALKLADEQRDKELARVARQYEKEHGLEPTRSLRGTMRFFPCCKHQRCKKIFVCFAKKEVKEAPEPLETQVLERTMIKIGSLLALGLGEAGAEIIGKNMRDNDTSAAISLVAGRQVDALFAFCGIRNFTVVTEVLQDEVMIFVNRIACLVHELCDEFWGHPNKNVGDAFLLVWRLSGHDVESQRRLSSMAFVALTSLVGRIATSSEMMPRFNAKQDSLSKRLRNRLVGFGLHLGWAIEGAIGTAFKIDASYLSKDVNLAARLEMDNQYYRSNILCSEAALENIGTELKEKCRQIDCVDYSGSGPIKVFTVDLDVSALTASVATDCVVAKVAKLKARLERQQRKRERWGDDFSLPHVFESDSCIVSMRAKFTEEFFARFQMAFLNYEAGNWPIACTMLEETRNMLSIEDGASVALLRLIQLHDFQAPKGWRGVREFGVNAKDLLQEKLQSCAVETSLDPNLLT